VTDKDHVYDGEKKKLVKKILRQVLSYHILPSHIDRDGLASNASFPTILKASDGSFHGQTRRIRMLGPLFHGVGASVNLYSKVRKFDVTAENGTS
jgi:hypothetical protein